MFPTPYSCYLMGLFSLDLIKEQTMKRFGLAMCLTMTAVACSGKQVPTQTAATNNVSPPPTKAVAPIPDKFRTVTTHLTVKGIDRAIEFYTSAFGAKTKFQLNNLDGTPMHVELMIGDSILMLAEENPQYGNKSPLTLGGTPASVQLFVEDSDQVFANAVAAGATIAKPLKNQFWGDRYGEVTDPFGHRWGISTRIENLTPEEIAARAQAALAPNAESKPETAPKTDEKPEKTNSVTEASEAATEIATSEITSKPKVSPIPEGFHTITPWLTLKDTAAAIDFYKQALGAKEVARLAGPEGRIIYALIRIGDSNIMLGDESPEMGSKAPQAFGGSPMDLMMYIPDVDATFAAVVANKATVKSPVADMFWGDRYGAVIDPFGYQWGLATHKEDLTPEQMIERMKKQMKPTKKMEEKFLPTETPAPAETPSPIEKTKTTEPSEETVQE